MKAAVLHAAGTPLAIEEVAIGKPGPHEVLVRTMAAGVCHSDLHFADGSWPWPMPAVLGHEAAGIVEAVGSEVRRLKPGDHVVTCLSAFCGHCHHCVTGHLSLCQDPDTQRGADEPPRLGSPDAPMGQFLNLSAFAEMMLIHEHACVAIRPKMPLDRAALIGCAVTTGIGAVIHSAGVRPGETVAVIGCGGVGLAAVAGARLAGAGRIVAIDRVPAKLDLARHFGATDTVIAGPDLAAQVIELTGGGVDHAIEAIGLPATCEAAFMMCARGGTATIVGMVPPTAMIQLPGAAFLGERRIQGSLMGSNRFPVDMPRYVDFYLQGRLDLDALISRRIALADVNQALDDLKTGELARSVIVFS